MTPATQKVVWVTHDGRVLKDFEVPKPGKNEVLIRNVAVASNPKDWKVAFFNKKYGNVEGNDVAGYIEAVGEGVTDFKVGDKVAAFTKMASKPGYGAYAEYSVSPAVTTFHLGPKSSFEDGAALPLAYMTAAIGLFQRLGFPYPGTAASKGSPVLVYGASTTVGVYAVQLAKKAGLHVVGIAGAGVATAKAYGCDEVIDYRGKSVEQIAAAIKASAGGKITKVFDCVAEKDAVPANILALPQGGQIAAVLPYPKKTPNLDKVKCEWTAVGNAYGGKIDAFVKELYKVAGDGLENGTLKAQKVTVIPGGLTGVTEGLRRLEKGESSAEKFVYRIAETPGVAKL